MNKYEEALNMLLMRTSEHLGFEMNYEKNLLQELVDKTTPKKVVNWLRDKSMACCPYCDSAGYSEEKHNHCYYCGQAIDWSGEDEKTR